MVKKTLRQTRRKLFVLVGLLSATVLTYNGCGTGFKVEEKTVDVSEWKKVDAKHFKSNVPGSLTVSRDEKNVYIVANQELYHADAANLKDTWTAIPLKGLDGSAAGKASFTTINPIQALSPTKEGVLVTLIGGAGPDNGVIFIKGKNSTPDAVWKSSAQDIGAALAGNTNTLRLDDMLYGVAIDSKGVDVPYFFGLHNAQMMGLAPGQFRLGAVTKADLSVTQFNTVVKRATNGFADANLQLAASPEYLFAVDARGVTTITSADVGTARDFLDIATTAAGPGNDGVVGSDHFQMKTGVANTGVRAVIVSNNNLFIGLEASTAHTGGVVVYEIKPSGTPPKVNKPDMNWNGISVLRLIKDDKGKVWAVTADAILEAQPDGKRGDNFLDSKETANLSADSTHDGYLKDSFPQNNIRGAEFINGELAVTTDKGLFIVEKTKKPVRSRKVVETE